MEIDNLPYDYLFERHSEEQIRRWINQLDYSYFIRASGGHANDADYFALKLHFESREELLYILGQLGIVLNHIPEGHPTPVAGRSYTFDEWAKLKDPIRDFPEYEEPGRITFQGIDAYCWIRNGAVNFSFSGQEERYEVTEVDFANCQKLEELIRSGGLVDKVSRSLESSVSCISRKKYGHLFR